MKIRRQLDPIGKRVNRRRAASEPRLGVFACELYPLRASAGPPAAHGRGLRLDFDEPCRETAPIGEVVLGGLAKLCDGCTIELADRAGRRPDD